VGLFACGGGGAGRASLSWLWSWGVDGVSWRGVGCSFDGYVEKLMAIFVLRDIRGGKCGLWLFGCLRGLLRPYGHWLLLLLGNL
jgi:hypothetical protein